MRLTPLFTAAVLVALLAGCTSAPDPAPGPSGAVPAPSFTEPARYGFVLDRKCGDGPSLGRYRVTVQDGEVGLLGNVAVTRELELRGAFRFDTEFDEALSLLAQGLPVEPVVTHTFPLDQSVAAFDLAQDRTVASKVLLDLSGA